jgi:hypothetical protein
VAISATDSFEDFMTEEEKRRMGRPPSVGGGKGADVLLSTRASSDMQKRLERWRKAQPDKPVKSEAVRRLLESALKAAGY